MKTVLLDIDDTLLNFKKSAKLSIKRACVDFNIQFSEELFNRYMEINEKLWLDYENCIIKREEIFQTRFALVFKEFNIDVNGIEFENAFGEYFKSEHEFIEGAKDILNYLSKKYEIYAASNAVFEVQLARLKNAGIYEYFKDIFVSDTIGYQKPTKEFFNECFSKITNFERNETIIIGDSLSSDIKGGYNAGIKTCWFNPEKKENTCGIQSDYEVNNLKEIKNIL